MDFAFLEELGITKNEAKIYAALLSLGSVQVGRIVYESGLHRSRVYEGLNRLAEKGLVSFVKKGKTTFYEATSSEKLLDVLDDEKLKLDKKRKRIQKLIPKLNTFRETKPRAEAHVLLGVEGFKAMRRDVLKHAHKDLLLIGAIAREDKVLPNFYGWWNKERVQRKIVFRILHKESARGKPMTKLKFSETRFLPKEIDNPAVINIYGDRVVNLVWKDDYPILFQLINKDIADSYRKYFDVLWKISKS